MKLRYREKTMEELEKELRKYARSFCSYYAEDIEIDINSLKHTYSELKGRIGTIYAHEEATIIIGFRDCGVDGRKYIQIRMKNPKVYGEMEHIYKKICVVKITNNKDRMRVYIANINPCKFNKTRNIIMS